MLVKRLSCLLIFLFLTCAPRPAWSRGGGGCVVEGTPVLTPGGQVYIENLNIGSLIRGFSEGRLETSRVHACVEVDAERHLAISAEGGTLRVTPEHPLMTAPGEYRLAGHLKPGDTVYQVRDGTIHAVPLGSIREVFERRRAYNLMVSPGGTFTAAGFVVHNKGCFLPDSPILKPDGTEIQISAVQPGDRLLAFTPEGRLVNAEVRKILRHEVDEYLLLKTDRQTVRVTRDHPFYVGNGTFRTLEGLSVGDTIIAWDGRSLAGQRIVSVERVRERVPVFNLQTDHPNTFFAGRLAVHNKGGCFPGGTRITTPRGAVPIESLAPGDVVMGVADDGCTVPTAVKSLLLARGRTLRIETDRQTLMVTDEHPIALWEGGFKEAGRLQPGDRIREWKDGRQLMSAVLSRSAVPEESLVFNLQVGNPHTFIAESTPVHNKGGGCFPAGTLICTPGGQVPIETLSPGDLVLALDPEGRFVHAEVGAVFAAPSRVLVVDTDRGTLRTTDEHPLARPDGTFLPAGELNPRDRLLVLAKGILRRARVHGTSREEPFQEVFNLTVTSPHTFVAAGFVVHNKGGGFRSSGGSHSGGGLGPNPFKVLTPMDWILISILLLALPVTLVILGLLGKLGNISKSENLDFVYSSKDVSRKSVKTEKLLAFLGRQDPSVSPEELRKLAEGTFLTLQECWEKRDYGPMKPLLMESLFNQHSAQLQGMLRNHEINRLENLKVERVDLVNVRYTEKKDHREFTALISAWVRDHYVDDRTGAFLRGDQSPARFQEFWTFQRSGEGWLLREIEQAGESDYLKDENFVEALTDDTVQGIYREAAKEGVAGPWLSKREDKKADRTERLLNFLVRTDKLWDRTQMLERARRVFLGVYLARESGDPDRIPVDDLFPEAAENLRRQMRQWQSDGLSVEYRNLCVRKAELILVRNYATQSKDEFTVRIDAHAQKIVRKGDKVFSEQDYVTPFEEYWIFGRRLGQWKLKEVLPPARGKERGAMENVDEESSPEQLQWYYRQSRAL